ncbi:MAG: fibronectin type III-like domain-contianing protein, partial [Muribaculaceae bacterium]|nr:fibronectin type III-like domain-contianing protein [Muribaculaceae bacterium]
PGKEIVQLYAAAPDAAKSNKPEKELRAFAKTSELKPGESQTVTMTVAAKDLASFDEAASEWVVAPGTYQLLIGASSRDIRHKLDVDVAESHEPVNRLFAPAAKLNTLKR